MCGVTYSNKEIKCYKCDYLLTVVNSKPEGGEGRTRIYCQLAKCPFETEAEWGATKQNDIIQTDWRRGKTEK